jgi:hypothetical protein
MGMRVLRGDQMTEQPETPQPKLLLKGKFGIFETPEGGVHLVFKLEGQEDDKHMEFTPFMLKAMAMAFPGKGNPLDMLRMGSGQSSVE